MRRFPQRGKWVEREIPDGMRPDHTEIENFYSRLCFTCFPQAWGRAEKLANPCRQAEAVPLELSFSALLAI